MRIHNLRRALAAFSLVVVALLALACGGAALAPAAQHTEDTSGFLEYSMEESAQSAPSPEGRAGPPGSQGVGGPAGSHGAAGRISRETSSAAAPAMPAAAAATAIPRPAQPQSAPAASAADRPGKGSADGGTSQSVQPQSARQLIVESWISIEVTTIDAHVRQVEALAAQSGGWVESSEIYGDAGYRSATVRIRVPADRLNNSLDGLRALGRVTDEGVSSTDVTERLIDNQARLKAWYAQEGRLVTLLENAPTVEDIIQIEQRIAQVRSDIEHVEATQRNLTNRVATSLITVHLQLPNRYAADPPAGFLNLSVGDPSAAAVALIARVETLNGYVGEKREFDEGDGRVVDLVVFVKSADLAGLMDYAATLGAASDRHLNSVGPAPVNDVPNARFMLGIRSNVELGASVSLSTAEPLDVAGRIRQRAESSGGFVERWTESRRDDYEGVDIELVVSSADLRAIMDFAADLGDVKHWEYNATGQNPDADAPNARLRVSVFTSENYTETWITIAAIVAAVTVVGAIIAVVLVVRSRRNRRRSMGSSGVRSLEADSTT